MPSSKPAKLSDKQYENLGRVMAAVYETGYLDANKSYKQAFIKGLFQGLGATLGATLIVAIVLWGLSLFEEVPLLGGFIDQIVTIVNRP